MAVESLVLAVNPGSSSRKYALYNRNRLLVSLHFEHENGQIVCTVETADNKYKIDNPISNLINAPSQVVPIIKQTGVVKSVNIKCIGLRVVAPTSFFLRDHLLDDEVLAKLKNLEARAPLHIGATLQESIHLKQCFKDIPIVLVSDSAFHVTKPDVTWNYAIHLEDADKYEIKRFGYHGISLASVTRHLHEQSKLPEKLIICHLGSGSSITAVVNGESVDTTMGYSPLEGLMMATRSGPMDVVAAITLKNELQMSDDEFESYLNKTSGLYGISGKSSDIRVLIDNEAAGDYRAGLALRMFVYHIQQAIGKLAASMDGVETLVFTGTVGERSFIIRKRIIDKLSFLGFAINDELNTKVTDPKTLCRINPRTRNKAVYVIKTDEALEIARRSLACMN